MLYGFVKILMTTALRFYYRRVYATGFETIPIQGPAILIANHHSSLMDAAILGVLSKRPIYYFARGDVFKNKVVAAILQALHMMPVYHHESGKESIDANNKSFSKATEILSNGGIIVFFPEGSSHIDKKLDPLRKGVFRLAFQTAGHNNFKFDIPIIPVGINYTHPTAYQHEVMVHAGTPLLLNNYKAAYLVNKAATLLQITKDSYTALYKKVLHVTDIANHNMASACLQVKRNDYTFFTEGWQQATLNRYEEEKEICNRINELPESSLIVLRPKTTLYFQQLKQYGVDDVLFSRGFAMPSFLVILLIAGLPVFLTGYFLNALPILIAKRIADTKVYREDFYSWILVAVAAVLHFVWVLLLFAGCMLLGWQNAGMVILLTLITAPFAHNYLLWWQQYRQYNRFKQLQKNNPAVIEALQTLRGEINKAL